MAKSLMITFDEKDESVLMSFFKKLKIKTMSAQKQAIQARIQHAIQSGQWDTFDEEEKEDFVFGAMIMETDMNKTVDTKNFKQELKAQINAL
jgi:hypothetical protein